MPEFTDSDATLESLRTQIEAIYESFSALKHDAVNLAHHVDTQDATAQLNNVLQTTEDAATTIITSASTIAGMAPDNAAIQAEVTKIYEACSFQDISGQRITKVLTHLVALESGMQKLLSTAKITVSAEDRLPEAFLAGPQLTQSAPTQADIDKLFSTF